MVREAEHVPVEGDDGHVHREETLDVAVPKDRAEEFEGPPLRFRREFRLADQEPHEDHTRGDADASRPEDDRLRHAGPQGEEPGPESRDEAAERHEVEERHELCAVLDVRMVVHHRERRRDLRRRPETEHHEEDGRQVRAKGFRGRRPNARDEQEDRGRGQEVREDQDPLASPPVAKRPEIADRGDLGERIHGEQEPFPERVGRVGEHHALHDRDPGERRGPHHERREV